MLTESVSDPRRANWLTISSTSEDLCWTEEFNTSRPAWELEAEVLRLTTRLMLRERELRQAKSQLKTQTTKFQQQASSWRKKIEEKDDQMKQLLVQKDSEMQNIVSQLLLFEAELRQEQSRIEDLLQQKDTQILAQQKEIERLKHFSSSAHAPRETSAHLKVEQNRESPVSFFEGNPPADKRTIHSFRGSSIDSDKAKSRIQAYQSNELDDSDYAVQKLKDGLAKIRAIQDVTNVQSLDFSHDGVFTEKKRTPHRTPQKMKDLKAKRINTHKIQRSLITDTGSLAIL